MSNSAFIIMTKPTELQPQVPAIYVHWHGGVGSVTAIAEICKERLYRDPTKDAKYALARMAGVWHEFFGIADGLSLGFMTYEEGDEYGCDNGAYVIGKDWEIVKHFKNGKRLPIAPIGDYELNQYDGIKKFMKELTEKLKEADKAVR